VWIFILFSDTLQSGAGVLLSLSLFSDLNRIRKIPESARPAGCEVRSSESTASSRAPVTMKPKRTILCVDDNEQSLSIRKVMLETRGYRVLTCNNGEQAVEMFRHGGVDLVLTDLCMPGLDGTELIEKIKELSPQTPAILFSGKIRIYDRDTRADVFLPKGMYAPVELLERIRLLLVRKRGPKRVARVEDAAIRASVAS
jgi:two-component system response regulator CpxR